jgi:hypothetical protein
VSDIPVQLVIRAKADQARAEIAQTNATLASLGAQARTAAGQLAGSSAGLGALGSASSAAGVAATALNGDVQGLIATLRQAEGLTEDQAVALAALAGSWAGLEASVDPVVVAYARFAEAEEVASRAVAAGIVTTERAGEVLDSFAIKLGLAENLTERQAAEAARLTQSMAALRASLDPTVAAEQRLVEAQAMVSRAIAAGVVSAAEGKAALDGLAIKLGLVEGAAESAAAAQMRLRAHSGAATAQLGNLTAQWNDVIMMTLAGQSPMQMAIQQGTQITQSFGNAGAAGAMRMMASSALAMLNPFNLATIAAIAGGAALVQAFMGAGEEAKTVEDAVGGLKSAIGDLKTEAGRDLKALKADFGAITPEVLELQDALTRVAATNALASSIEALKALRAETQGSWWSIFSGNFTDAGARSQIIGDQPFVPTQLANGMTGLSQPTVDRFVAALDAGVGAKGLAAQLSAVLEIRSAFEDVTKGQETLTEAQRSFLKGVLDTEAGLRRLIAAQTESVKAGGAQDAAMVGELAQGLRRPRDPAARDNLAEAGRMRAELQAEADIQAVISRFGEDSWRVTVARVAAERQAFQVSQARLGVSGDELRNDMARWDAAKGIVAERRKLQQTVIDPASAALDRVDKAQATADALQRQAEMQRLVADYGEDSLVVTLARVAAERQVFEEQERAAGQSGVMLDKLMAAWDAANGLASVDIAGRIAAAVGPASQLAEYMRQAAGYWGAAQGFLQRASESGGWVGSLVGRLGWGATDEAPLISPPPRTRPPGFGVDMDGDGIPDASQTGGAAGGGGDRGGGAAGDTVASLQKEAAEALKALDLAVATIQEKVRAGVMGSAEAGDAVVSAKDRAADALAELVAKLEALGPAGAAAAAKLREALGNLGKDLRGGDLAEGLKDVKETFAGMGSEALAGIRTADDALEALRSTVQRLIADLLKERLLTPLLDSLFSGIGLTASAKGNVIAGGKVSAFELGGLADATAVPSLKGLRDQIVDRPIVFPMTGGIGLAGEADPEAIMPLIRGGIRALGPDGEGILPLARSASGHLAVRMPALRPFAFGGVPAWARVPDSGGAPRSGQSEAAAAPGRGLRVEIHNNAHGRGEAVQAEMSADGDGDVLRIFVDQVAGALSDDIDRNRGKLPASIARSFGLRRPGR